MKKIVVIGGGTGQGNILEGLKKFTDKITAIVTVADDGGGSGLIRTENKMLPPGDIRNCLIALADMDDLTERLISHRFTSGSIKNQSFGNLMILAYYEIFGDFEKSINYVGQRIGAKGKVVPSTREHIRLVANLDNGSVVIGESNIAQMSIAQRSEINKLELLPTKPRATQSAVDAIRDADIIIVGPGSLYTSIIANLLIPEIQEELIKSKAKKVFIANIMSENGETDKLNVLNHYEKILKHIPNLKLDYMFINTAVVEGEVKEKYKEEKKEQVSFDEEQQKYLENFGIEVVAKDFLKVTDFGHIIHDNIKVATEIFRL